MGTEKEKEEEERERLANFFSAIHEFFIPSNTPTNTFVLAELPARHAIVFIPAASPVVNPVILSSSVASVSLLSPDYSVVPSVNFFPACIETNTELCPMTSIERPEASNTWAPS